MGTCRYRDQFHSVLTSCRLCTLTLNVDTADSHPENVDVEVAEYDSSTDEEEEVKGGDLTDGQLSYWELPHVMGDKPGSTTDF